MRIQLILTLVFSLTVANAADESSMQKLFTNYQSVMKEKNIELIDEVFTERFIQQSGGKKELIEKIKEFSSSSSSEKKKKPKFNWRKGTRGNIYFAKMTGESKEERANLIILEKNGKLKIDGTISDDN